MRCVLYCHSGVARAEEPTTQQSPAFTDREDAAKERRKGEQEREKESLPVQQYIRAILQAKGQGGADANDHTVYSKAVPLTVLPRAVLCVCSLT